VRILQQKSRPNWIKIDDSNTNTFHASLNAWSHVKITYLVDEAGNQIQEQNKIKDMFRGCFFYGRCGGLYRDLPLPQCTLTVFRKHQNYSPAAKGSVGKLQLRKSSWLCGRLERTKPQALMGIQPVFTRKTGESSRRTLHKLCLPEVKCFITLVPKQL